MPESVRFAVFTGLSLLVIAGVLVIGAGLLWLTALAFRAMGIT